METVCQEEFGKDIGLVHEVVLNVADVPTLKAAIARGDATALTRVFGIGKKSAERIVVELRDKLAKEAPLGLAHASGSGNDAEVLEALIALLLSHCRSRPQDRGNTSLWATTRQLKYLH